MSEIADNDSARLGFFDGPSVGSHLFAKAGGGTLRGPVEFWHGLGLRAAYERSVESHAKALFWVLWAVLIALALYAFFYAENRWLEG